MNAQLLFLSFLFFSSSLFGQKNTSKLFIHFQYDKFNLQKAEAQKLDVFFNAIDFEIEKIELVGHTDSDGSDAYNMALSEKRANTIRAYLVEKGIAESIIVFSFLGEQVPIEENTTAEGKQQNRRVEIVFYKKEVVEKIKLPEPEMVLEKEEPVVEEIPEAKKDPLVGDTVLIVDGVQIVISKKDHSKYKDCMKITPILDGRRAIRNDIQTITVNNNLLVSCGMINIEFDPPCEGCFDKPLKVRFPVRDKRCDVFAGRQIFDSENGNTWTEAPNGKIRKVRIDRMYYYEMPVRCPGWKNCDVYQSGDKPIKFKLARNYHFAQLNVTCDCPLAIYNFEVNKRKVKGTIPCGLSEKEIFVYFEAINPNGEKIKGERIPLEDLKHSIWKRCTRKFLGMGFWYAKKSKSKIYSKFKITQAILGSIKKIG